MFFRTLVALTLLLAITGTTQAGYASEPEFEIEQEELFPDVMKIYQRGFIVTSNYYPSARNISPIIIPEMSWPTADRVISSDYGYRTPSCKLCSSDHKGIDFVPGFGEPVYAAMDGIVSRIEDSGGFGLHIYVDHIANINGKIERWQTVYAHLKRDARQENLKVGDIVFAGTKIAEVGNSGLSTGPHLHFELLVEGENVDPEHYLLMYAN